MSKRLRLRTILEPRMDAPFPLWMVFPVIFALLYVSSFSLLRLPYYWDEAGYYIPAAWDFFRTGSLIPYHHDVECASAAAQRLPGAWWKLSGFYPEVTREAVLMIASIGLARGLATRASCRRFRPGGLLDSRADGVVPIWFAQSTLAQADIFAAAFTLWGLVYALPDGDRKPRVAAVVVHCCRALEGNRHRDSDDAGGVWRWWMDFDAARPAEEGAAGTMPPGSLPVLCRLIGVVRLAFRQNRVRLRQSGVSEVQRPGQPRTGALSRGLRTPSAAPHGAHEHVCAVAADRRRT